MILRLLISLKTIIDTNNNIFISVQIKINT